MRLWGVHRLSLDPLQKAVLLLKKLNTLVDQMETTTKHSKAKKIRNLMPGNHQVMSPSLQKERNFAGPRRSPHLPLRACLAPGDALGLRLGPGVSSRKPTAVGSYPSSQDRPTAMEDLVPLTKALWEFPFHLLKPPGKESSN